MALTFVVEDGTGLSTATSYASVEAADAYMERVVDTYRSAWLDADTFAKRQALVWATGLLDQWVYFPGTKWGTNRVKINQALQFPRYGIVDQDEYTVPSNIVPPFMIHATSQLAFELLKTDLSAEPLTGITSATVGPIAVDFDTNQAHKVRAIPRSVAVIVLPFGGVIRGSSGTKSVPLRRA